MGEAQDHNLEIIMHYNDSGKGVDVLEKLVREYTCMRSTRH